MVLIGEVPGLTPINVWTIVVRLIGDSARYSDRLSSMQQALHVALDRTGGRVAAALGGRVSTPRVETKGERICAGGYTRAQKRTNPATEAAFEFLFISAPSSGVEFFGQSETQCSNLETKHNLIYLQCIAVFPCTQSVSNYGSFEEY